AVAAALRTKLLGGGGASDSRDRPPGGDLTAYEAVLQGNFLGERRTESDLREAAAMYERAVQIDPRYAYANAKLGLVLIARLNLTKAAEVPALAAKARAAVDKALELDPNLADALVARGRMISTLAFDIKESEADFRRAAELAPQDPTVLRWLAG